MSALSPRQMFELDTAARPIAEAFDVTPYLVGSAVQRETYRDVDIRLMLDQPAWESLAAAGPHVIEFLGVAIGAYLERATGLPVDFQIQHREAANSRFGGEVRNPLGLRTLDNFRGDAWSPQINPAGGKP